MKAIKAIIGCLLFCLPAFAADTNEIRVVTWKEAKGPPGYSVTCEEFTRSGQTNLLRITTFKDGVTNSITHNFYHQGTYLGRYSRADGNTFVNSAAHAPYMLNFVWDASNQIRGAGVMTTNYVILDSFTCTNGIFYPEDGSRIEESNRKTKDILHR
jgi:hypothetical protein